MNNRKDSIEFSIAKVTTEQFAIIEKAFADKEEINLNINLRFSVDRDQRIVSVFTLFTFEQKGLPFIVVEVSCHFLIAEKSWATFINDKITTNIPKEFITHLTMITVGTTRGVLHTKTEGTRFNEFVLPTINVAEIITEDISFT